MENIKINQVKKEDKHELVDFLLNHHDYKAKKEYWLNLFNHSWSKENNFGYKISNQNKIVGYFGLVYTSKILFGKKVLNLHSWVVQKEYRGHSIKLLKRIISLENVFLISHSTITKILKIYFRFKWKIFDEYFCYLFGSFYPSKNINFELIDNSNYLDLSENNLKIYLDHRKYGFAFYRTKINNKELLIIGKIKKLKKLFNFFEIVYVSDIEIFCLYGHQFINNFKTKTNSNFCRIDGRFINQKNKMVSKKFKMKGFKKIYFCKDKIDNINLSKINNLYSEIFLLDL